MIALTQITNTAIVALIAVLVFKLLSRKVLFKNRKDNRKSRQRFKKIAHFTVKLLQRTPLFLGTPFLTEHLW